MNLLKWKGVTMPSQQQQQQQEQDESNDDDDKCSILSSVRGDLPIATNTLRVSIRNAQKDIHLDEMGIDSNINRVRLSSFLLLCANKTREMRKSNQLFSTFI
jgi:hypothetical protein